ncbi:hypothetical protein [Hymenobacter antarcticus]|uniref:Uncharacterized protein n=1 Tax=Hymenobacter antarcticus TaxID=486270 RepID=A0ABP7PX78_9BACT
MMDLHLMPDQQDDNSEAYDWKSAYLGGIGLQEFHDAQEGNILAHELDYYEDFRWSSEFVKKILSELIDANNHSFFNLIKILERAAKLDCGVYAVAD